MSKRRPVVKQEDRGGGDVKRPKTLDSRADSLRWACPFFILLPGRFKSVKACAGAGFTDISRLKEHLYRCHSRPPSCARCHSVFINESGLTAHLQRPESCSLVKSDVKYCPEDGIDQQTMLAIRSRKRTANQSDMDKWNDIWNQLFPNRPLPDSPYMKPQHLEQEVLDSFQKYAVNTVEQLIAEDSIETESPVNASSMSELWSRIFGKVVAKYLRSSKPTEIKTEDESAVEESQSQPVSEVSATDSCSTILSPGSTYLDSTAQSMWNSPPLEEPIIFDFGTNLQYPSNYEFGCSYENESLPSAIYPPEQFNYDILGTAATCGNSLLMVGGAFGIPNNSIQTTDCCEQNSPIFISNEAVDD
ncbi:hypothetical protein BX600DRAFT_472202 [Xylariales sp. PMI_506]|nr:hypothetical protein BX600DRAFT_472202 [Xylariales sp. PMI_506]